MNDYAEVCAYYDCRAEQFASLQEAHRLFESKGSEQDMWFSLIEYAVLREAADNLFNKMSDDTITVLVQRHGVRMIVCISDE